VICSSADKVDVDWEVICSSADKVDVSGPGVAQFVLVEPLIADRAGQQRLLQLQPLLLLRTRS